MVLSDRFTVMVAYPAELSGGFRKWADHTLRLPARSEDLRAWPKRKAPQDIAMFLAMCATFRRWVISSTFSFTERWWEGLRFLGTTGGMDENVSSLRLSGEMESGRRRIST